MNVSEQTVPPWRIIDGIGPFFRHVGAKRINWSKIPFRLWELEGRPDHGRVEQAIEDTHRFLEHTAAEGYNAVTFDDVAHAARWDGYPATLQQKIDDYRGLYERLFNTAKAQGLRPLLTTDVLPFARGCEKEMNPSARFAASWLAQRLDTLFADFPDLAGVVMRIGECDGVKERGDFLSRLVIRTPRQARHLLRVLLPVFERHRRTLFFRLWTVGAYPIGDLMWHRGTFRAVFEGIDSPSLVLSLKYGESDFFRYLPLNAHFFRSNHRKIIEFQARPEYEGFGEYPSFVGIRAQRVLEEIASAPNMIGISVWCQTGGWGRFRRLTYLRDSSPWVELNVSVLSALARGGDWERAAVEWLTRYAHEADVSVFPEFLRLSDEVIERVLYVRAFALRKLFFRRLRLPPLLYVLWDRILVNRSLRAILRAHVLDRDGAVADGEEAFQGMQTMLDLARQHRLPDTGLEFQRDTFRLLLAVRRYYLADSSPEHVEQIRALKKAYKRAWPRRYAIRLDVKSDLLFNRRVRWPLALLFRQQRGYRLLDHVVALRLLRLLYPVMRGLHPRLVPRFAHKQAMGIDLLFR